MMRAGILAASLLALAACATASDRSQHRLEFLGSRIFVPALVNGGLGGGVGRDIVVLTSLRIGDELFEGVAAAINPTENAAGLNIGAAILRNFVITTDFPQRALWLERKK